ncbi:MAG TPA: staygreen family protein [Thermoleophilia bacterium]|nr:staygreen family protein [Thermoleophilia bacterium]
MLDASRLQVTFTYGAQPIGPLTPRRYTLTHSDLTGDLFLTIGPDYDHHALHALQVRLERDEVLGEWVLGADGPRLDLHMAAQGGLPVFGTGAMRCSIFRRYRPMVHEALRYGDRVFAKAHPELDDAPVIARFRWRSGRVESEPWGRWGCAER